MPDNFDRPVAERTRERSFEGQGTSEPVGLPDNLLGDRAALRFILVEHLGRTAVAEHRRQPNSQLNGVLDGDIHSLTAGGTVDVCCIADEEDAPGAEAGGDPVMHAEARGPGDLANGDTVSGTAAVEKRLQLGRARNLRRVIRSGGE